jgi:hypothetical protein
MNSQREILKVFHCEQGGEVREGVTVKFISKV